MKPSNLFVWGHLGLLALLLAGCGGSEKSGDSGQQPRNLAGQSRGNLGNPEPVAPAKASASSAVNGMNDSIGSDWDKFQREKMQNDAAQADKDRQFKADQRALDRKHDATMEDKRIADKKEGRFMTTLKELMQMQMAAGMIHPDKCANKGFISGLKGTADALREAMAPTEVAAAQEASGKPADLLNGSGSNGGSGSGAQVLLPEVKPTSSTQAPATTSGPGITNAVAPTAPISPAAPAAPVMGPPAPAVTNNPTPPVVAPDAQASASNAAKELGKVIVTELKE